jgi:molybdenum cofactor cytidylyltransferase
LIRCPRHARAGIAHVHSRPAALTPDVDLKVGHRRILTHGRDDRIYDRAVIPAVVLAAGLSNRMGRSKANLPIGSDDTFLTRIVRTFQDAGVDDVVVVVGHDAEAIAATFERSGLAARFVHNAQFARGQLSSILAGLRAVDRPGVAAMLLTLVDVPLVTSATVRAVIAHYRSTRAPIVRPTSGSRHGHPVLIDRSVFAALRVADPGAGAKPVVRAHASPAGDIPIDDEGAFTDVDTPEEYTRLTIQHR